MTEPKDRSAIVLPFGKHKGSTVAELLVRDPAYAEWIVAQGWVAERFAELHAAILSRGAASDDSPEHNAIQVRFLDETFRRALIRAHERFLPAARMSIRTYYNHDATNEEYRTGVRFEQRGIDVVIDVTIGEHVPMRKPWGENSNWERFVLSIEIKPTMGDDFPSVMRQMERLQCGTLVVGDYTGRAVSAPQLSQMFEANGKRLVFVRDIEAEIANARAELE